MTNSYKYLYWNNGNTLGEYNIIKNERDMHELPSPRYSRRAEFLLSIINNKCKKIPFLPVLPSQVFMYALQNISCI